MYESLKNWGRWGADDQRGTLNHLTDARRAAAAGLVRSGESISLAHDLATEPLPEHPHPVQHHMLASGDARDSNGIPGYEAARDHLALDVHGLSTTHVDALSHMFVRGEMYGGRPASEVRSDGARANTVLSMADGVVGRGVLLDVPRALGIDFLEHRRGGHGRPTSRRPSRPRASRSARATSLLVAWGREARTAADPGVRRVRRPARRMPAVAAGARGGGARQRRDLRPDAVRGHARVAVPGPPDRDHRHGPAPHRQRARWPRWADGAPPPGGGSSSSPWPPCASPRAPGARSTRWPCCDAHARRAPGAACSATPAPPTSATSRRWPRCSIPTPTIAGARRRPDRRASGWRRCGRPRAFPTSMHLLGDPLIDLADGGTDGPRSTPTPSSTSSATRARAAATSPSGIRYLDERGRARRAVASSAAATSRTVWMR